MSKETNEVMVRTLPFNGKQADWDIWADKFASIAQAKGYVMALFDGDTALPLQSDVTLDETVPADKLALKALERNYNAMLALTMAVSDFPVGKSYSERAKTPEFERELANNVWSRLVVKYTPTNAVMIAKYRIALAECKQNKAESPADYCSRLVAMQNKIIVLRATCPEANIVTQF
jgi:hypothetical protein